MSECSCHINPPCSYCTELKECNICAQIFHPDDADGFIDVCGECGSEFGELEINEYL